MELWWVLRTPGKISDGGSGAIMIPTGGFSKLHVLFKVIEIKVVNSPIQSVVVKSPIRS